METTTEAPAEATESPTEAPAETATEATETETETDSPESEADPVDPPALPPADEPEAVYSPSDFTKASTERTDLAAQLEDVDSKLEELEKAVEDGTIDSIEASSKIQLLTAKQSKLNRKIEAADKVIGDHKANEKTAADSMWTDIGKNYAVDIGKTPEEAKTLLRSMWNEEVDKVAKASPKASEDYIRGKAEARWEQRIIVLRAKQKGNPAPAGKPKDYKRLTPGPSGSGPAPKGESAAERVRRTVGPLSDWKV